MEFLDVLNGKANRFDKGFPVVPSDAKALRDAVVYCLDKIKSLEARLEAKKSETPKSEPTEEIVTETKKRGRPVRLPNV